MKTVIILATIMLVIAPVMMMINDIKYQKEMKEMRERLEKEGSWEIREI